jgi:hypothetical protein
MSKDKYLIFTNNKLPRLVTNPSDELLTTFDKDQLVKNPRLKRFKGVALEHLILENKEIRKASKLEISNINTMVNNGENVAIENRRIVMESKQKEIETKMKEILSIVNEQESVLEQCREELKQLKVRKVWKVIAILSLCGNIVPVFNVLQPLVQELLK